MIFVDCNNVPYTPSKFLTYDDVQLVPQFSDIKSRNDASVTTECNFTSQTKMRTPIVSANMDTVTEYDMANTMFNYGGYGILHRFYGNKYADQGFNIFMEQIQKLHKNGIVPAFSIGVAQEDLSVVRKVLEVAPRAIVTVDVAHGHSKQCTDQCKRLRELFTNKVEIIAGNVATQEGVAELVFNGMVDSCKVGLGNGSNCTTRIITGHGVPQLTAIIKAREAINKMKSNCTIIADGGIRNAGDIVKALAAGADCVMLGSLLSATTETPTELTPEGTRLYRGMSSAMVNQELGKKVAAEGVSFYKKDKGSVAKILEELIGGIRSGLTYSGVRTPRELSNKAKFIEVTPAAQKEAFPHGLLENNYV